jgi:hypothetical protein
MRRPLAYARGYRLSMERSYVPDNVRSSYQQSHKHNRDPLNDYQTTG